MIVIISTVCSLWQFLSHNAAAIIALCALGLTAYQVRATRRHNRLSVRPLLSTNLDRKFDEGRGSIEIALMSSGLGPALIKSYLLSLDGSPINVRMPIEIDSTFKRIVGETLTNLSVGSLDNNYALRRDETKTMIKLEFRAATQAEFDGVDARIQRLRLVVEYASLYGENFTLDSDLSDR